MTDQQFADLFAISQASPGPNILIVTLVGYQVAGVAGALVTTAAMCGPPCLFVYFAGRVWNRFRHARWRILVQAGLVPVSIGLIAAAAMVLARAADHNWVAVLVTVVEAFTTAGEVGVAVGVLVASLGAAGVGLPAVVGGDRWSPALSAGPGM